MLLWAEKCTGFILEGRKSGQGRQTPSSAQLSLLKETINGQLPKPVSVSHVAIHLLCTSTVHMTMLMPLNYVPKDMLRCQVYTCKTDEWVVWKMCSLCPLQANGITSLPPAHTGQPFTFLFAFPRSLVCLRVSSQSIYLTNSWQARTCDWEVVKDGCAHAPRGPW